MATPRKLRTLRLKVAAKQAELAELQQACSGSDSSEGSNSNSNSLSLHEHKAKLIRLERDLKSLSRELELEERLYAVERELEIKLNAFRKRCEIALLCDMAKIEKEKEKLTALTDGYARNAQKAADKPIAEFDAALDALAAKHTAEQKPTVDENAALVDALGWFKDLNSDQQEQKDGDDGTTVSSGTNQNS